MTSDRPDEVSKEQREFSRRRFLKHAGVAAALVPAYGGLAGILAEQGAGAATYKRNSDNAFFVSHPKYHFVMVNHVTTNSFFTATIYGCQDACALTGCSFQWTGSQNSIAGQMVSAMNSAIAARARGIGVCLINDTAFNAPVNTALSHGIPVIAYNADVSPGVKNNRMAYVGQNNLTAGAAVGTEILKHVKKGDLVAGIIATPGTGNIQPRLDGAMLDWLLAMLRNCTPAAYARNKHRMVRLAEYSRDQLDRLRDAERYERHHDDLARHAHPHDQEARQPCPAGHQRPDQPADAAYAERRQVAERPLLQHETGVVQDGRDQPEDDAVEQAVSSEPA